MDALDASSLKHTAGFIDRWSASVAEGRVAEGRVAEGRVAEGRVAEGRVAEGRTK